MKIQVRFLRSFQWDCSGVNHSYICMYFTLLDLSGKDQSFIAHCDSTHLGGNSVRLQGDHSNHVIKLQVMFEGSLEWNGSG